MSRWGHLDTDAERLPDGMHRIGYDADTQVYTYRDSEDGTLWEGAPGAEYGRLHRVRPLSETHPLPSVWIGEDDTYTCEVKVPKRRDSGVSRATSSATTKSRSSGRAPVVNPFELEELSDSANDDSDTEVGSSDYMYDSWSDDDDDDWTKRRGSVAPKNVTVLGGQHHHSLRGEIRYRRAEDKTSTPLSTSVKSSNDSDEPTSPISRLVRRLTNRSSASNGTKGFKNDIQRRRHVEEAAQWARGETQDVHKTRARRDTR